MALKYQRKSKANLQGREKDAFMLEVQSTDLRAFVEVWMGREKGNEFEMNFQPRWVVITFNFLVSVGLSVMFCQAGCF